MSEPLVSVIVPIYNAKDNIVRCVESIRRQTYQNLEILLLNDGSKDVSYPVCEMFAKTDKRIVLIDKENSGVSATRNLGMRVATGKYLQFVDADDTLEPFATQLMVERAEEHSADLVIAAYNRIVPYKEKKVGASHGDPLVPEKPELAARLINLEGFHTRVLVNQAQTQRELALARELAAYLHCPVAAGELLKEKMICLC